MLANVLFWPSVRDAKRRASEHDHTAGDRAAYKAATSGDGGGCVKSEKTTLDAITTAMTTKLATVVHTVRE